MKIVLQIFSLLCLLIAVPCHLVSFFTDWSDQFDEFLCIFAAILPVVLLPTVVDELKHRKSLVYSQRALFLMSSQGFLISSLLWLYPIILAIIIWVINMLLNDGMNSNSHGVLIVVSAIPVSTFGSLFIYFQQVYGRKG